MFVLIIQEFVGAIVSNRRVHCHCILPLFFRLMKDSKARDFFIAQVPFKIYLCCMENYIIHLISYNFSRKTKRKFATIVFDFTTCVQLIRLSHIAYYNTVMLLKGIMSAVFGYWVRSPSTFSNLTMCTFFRNCLVFPI